MAVRDQIVSPRFIEVHRLNSFTPRGLATDIVLEVMIHDIDLARWLVGEEPAEIRAAGVPVLSRPTTSPIAVWHFPTAVSPI
jgi:predicted dehydrogenase